MTKEQIEKIILEAEFLKDSERPTCIETHISWVLLGDQFAYKIKKPILYSFLDFSTLEKRKYYCHREIELNRRFTDDIYLDVQAVRELGDRFFLGGVAGKIVDYAVKMRKLDRKKQMDVLLLNDQVTRVDIENLAKKIAVFHEKAEIIYNKDVMDIQTKFNDLQQGKEYLQKYFSADYIMMIDRAMNTCEDFVRKNRQLLESRLKAGFFRDGHGDLHSRNIFLLPDPQPFDCIEFNDEYRQVDVLDEVAFLCMDLDALDKRDLSNLFLQCYNSFFPSMKTDDERKLFVFYKSYRANIRAKVNSLRARSAANNAEAKSPLAETEKYLKLMNSYLEEIKD